MTKSLKASLLALALASLPHGAQAAGLGQINVLSGLGQPLRAEIQLSATAQELQSLNARIASPEAFRQANIGYSPAISGIRVSVDTKTGRPVIRLSSERPINEPFVDLLVEVDWASGRLVREYTFLLDPVEVVMPKPLAATVATPAAPPVAGRALPPVRPTASAAETYAVRRGDTLHRIANANMQPGVTLDQMLVALYRANPDAFDGDNLNRLRAGKVLTVPDAQAAQAIDPAEARREIRTQAADFEAYRRGLAAGVAQRAPEPAAAPEQQSAGRVVPRVEAQVADAGRGDQVQVSRREPGDADAASRLQALEEELASREKAIEEAHARLAQLEQSVRGMQRLLELQSGTLGQLQQQAGGAPAAEPAAPAADAGSVTPPTAAAPVGAPSAAPAEARPPAAPAPAPEPPSLIDSLLEDPAVVAGGGGILVLLLAYAGLKARQRRRQIEVHAAEPSFAADTVGGAQAVFAGTGGQSVDTGASSIIHTDFSQAGLSSIDTDEGVDPVAEADVYMAYGRDAQAEEILLDALKADPARTAIHLKLLEIYAQRKDVRQFEAIATELFGRSAGQGRDWERATALGRALDPDNPLYGSQKAEEDLFAPRATAAAAAAGLAGAAAPIGNSDATIVEDAAAAPARSGATPTEQALASLDFTTASPIEPSPSQLRDTWALPGGLRQFEADKEAAEEGQSAAAEALPALADAAPELPESLGADVLDFDLDLGEEVAPERPAAGREPGAEPAEPDSGLEFDLDIGEAESGPEAAEAGRPAGSVAAPDGGVEPVAALDFELPEIDFDLPEARPFDLDATVVDQDAHRPEAPTDSAAQPTPADEPVVDLEKTSFDSSLLDFDFDIDAPTPAPAPNPAALDLTSIDLELDNFDEPGAPAQEHGELSDLSVEETQIDPIAELPHEEAGPEAANEEAETKLELARAYDEMGDREGALELLDEVVREGSVAQQAEARKMIARLA